MDHEAMPAVRRRRTERRLAQAQQIVRPPQPLHTLVVHHPPLLAQPRRDGAVTLARMGDRQTLQRVAQRRLFLPRTRCLPVPVITSPAHTSQPAVSLDPHRIALLLRHRVDHRVDVVPPGPPFIRRLASTCRKAARKKSRSTCCWPIVRSSSASRRSGSAGSGRLSGVCADGWLSLGRPMRRKASAPPASYRRRHSYSRSGPTPSSPASAATPHPSSIRAIARSLNSTGQFCFRPRTLVLLA